MRFKKDDRVQKIQDPEWIGIVLDSGKVMAGIQYYSVDFLGHMGRQNVPEDSLRLYEKKDPRQSLLAGELANYDNFQRLITFFRVNKDEPLTSNVYSLNASRIAIYPHQFKPVLKIINSQTQRLLIADEVGLGKTIEAGLIYTELSARQSTRRALVVCPAKLTIKWQTEMLEKFDQEFRILNTSDFHNLLKDIRNDQHFPCKAIISHNIISDGEVIDDLEETRPLFDFIAIDEAHHLRNTKAKRNKAGKILSECSLGGLVMLTATPVNLNADELGNLLHLLDPIEFRGAAVIKIIKENENIVRAQNYMASIPPQTDNARLELEKMRGSHLVDDAELSVAIRAIEECSPKDHKAQVQVQERLADINLISHVFNRTRKRDVNLFKERKAISLEIEFSEKEAVFFKSVMGILKSIAPLKYPNAIIRNWVLNVPQQRMASSINAMVKFYRNNPDLLGLKASADEDDLDANFTVSPKDNLSPEIMANAVQLSKIINMWDINLTEDSKYIKLKDQLRKFRNEEKKYGRPLKTIVFAFFKDTLRYLNESLQKDGFRTILIVGGEPNSVEERKKYIDEFRESEEIEILLMSKVGSEGLDFQFCHIMFNYDLPWNPMELEQRIGRLDRIGQPSKVIQICNFWIKGTIEERILKRLYERIDIFRNSIGDLESVMGEITSTIHETFTSALENEAHLQEKIAVIENAIELKKIELEKFNKRSTEFIGTDRYLEEEINTAFKTKKFIPGEHLYLFLADFLKANAPRTTLTYDLSSKSGKIKPCIDLKNLLRETMTAQQVERYDREMDITFDSDTAFRNPNLNFINILHPFIQQAAKSLRTTEIPNAHTLLIPAKNPLKLKAGHYYYFAFKYQLSGIKPTSELGVVILDKNSEIVFSPKESYQVLASLIEHGKNYEKFFSDLDPAKIVAAYDNAVEIFVSYLHEAKEETEKTNTSMAEKRKRYVKEFYENRAKNYDERLQKAQAKSGDPKYKRILPMLEALKRQNLEQLSAQMEDIERKKTVDHSWSPLAAGLIIVE